MTGLLAKYEISDAEVHRAIDTAQWLYEINKGSDESITSGIKPEEPFGGAVGLVAYEILYQFFFNGDKLSEELMESMGLEPEELSLLRNMAKANAKRFLFGYIN